MSKSLLLGEAINRLHVPDFVKSGFVTGDDKDWELSNLKPINIFIGANNSGKSRLLRLMFSSTLSIYESDKLTATSYPEYLISLLDKHKLYSSLNLKTLPGTIDEFKEKLVREFKTNSRLCGYERIQITTKSALSSTLQLMDINAFSRRHSTQEQNPLIDGLIKRISGELPSFPSILDPSQKSIYIPLLRGLRPLSTSRNPCLERTITDYFKEQKTTRGVREQSKEETDFQSRIFTGESFYEDLKNSLLGSYEQRISVREYEDFLSDVFFRGEPISLIPRVKSDVVHFKLGNSEERPIYDLGDGIQSIIILTYKIFTTKYPTFFYIEEPEQHLHAGMQRVLIKALTLHPEHIYFLTSHSNHLIDIAMERDDISIQRVYQTRNEDKEESKILPLNKYSQVLEDLDVRASSVLLANCSIWLEGVTDKLYLRSFMNKYLRELDDTEKVDKLTSYLENLHYTFVEYQGSNITHWSFVEDTSQDQKSIATTLSQKIFLVADGDISWKGDRQKDLTEALGNSFQQLEYKEIENYIPIEVIRKTVENRWETFQNSRIDGCSLDVSKLNQKDIYNKTIGIGKKIETKCITKSKDNTHTFFEETSKSSTGTIKDKVKFCHEAVKIMNDSEFEWSLTPELSVLCEKIWKHIEEANG
ncbi:AAA family ATPase [Vibrio hepatarius]|uniref:AAA family ATPase n=1 Tax=Vibrio hepatarius TaxID=171383 RepID=UPI001C091487|nr:AAA family ATPase [Vibrio hepatarius]MBU2895463.1 ATP-binding protein [Vibrio hepatarius]